LPRDRLDQPTVYGARAKIGVIVPPTNTANEAEWARMAPAGVTVHSARMPLHTDTESEASMQALYQDVAKFAADLAQASVDLIAYGCTAGSMVSPVDGLPQFMADKTGKSAITTAQAIVEALRALGATRIALATPYHQALNDHEVHFLAEQGITVVHEEGLGYGAGGPQEYRNIARVPPEEVFELAKRVDRPEAQAVLISCTDLATLDVIDRLEAELGKPVISSNTATFWFALRRAAIGDRLNGFGTLLKDH
jgi:maleate cis-trans isomerase